VIFGTRCKRKQKKKKEKEKELPDWKDVAV
jgi:hypothetical protein